jgi:hypothetical protein
VGAPGYLGIHTEQASLCLAVAMTGHDPRGTLCAGIGLLVVAATLAAGRPLEASAVGGLNTVTVGPGHGKAA